MARRVETQPVASLASETLGGLTAVDALPILLVDDRPENLRTLEAVLAPLGFPLRTASSGSEALRMLLDEDYALILLDVRMPGLDGLEAARLIKERERTRDLPIVFLTAAQDELENVREGYEVGAVDYLIKPFDAELLRSKVTVLAELEASRRALKRSEAFLRGAFEAAPIGKTVLDRTRRIVRANPAFGRMLGRDADGLQGIEVSRLIHAEDREALDASLDRLAGREQAAPAANASEIDLRLTSADGEVWASAVASAIEAHDLTQPMLMVQWVDLTARRRAEQARAELLMEQAARTQAEATTRRLKKLQALTEAFETLTLEELLPELALRLGSLFDAAIAEVEVDAEGRDPVVVRVAGEQVLAEEEGGTVPPDPWHEAPLRIEQSTIGTVRLAMGPGRDFNAEDRALLHDAADRAALSIRRAQLHEEEHRIAVELQRGLLPEALPKVQGVELAAHYQAAGLGAEVGGDWYDAFALGAGRVGIIVGDVAGRGIPAASAMGQLRSMVRGFALGDNQRRTPDEVLNRLNEHQLTVGSEEVFTIVYAIVDPGERTISWASAAHPPPLLRHAGGEIAFLDGGEGLMAMEERIYRTRHSPIGPDGTLVFYTDGLVERRGESLDAGLRRLCLATESGPAGPAALCQHLLREVLPTSGQLQDDVTALVVRVP